MAKTEALGPTPLEVLLESMHAARAEGERAEAVECAKAAAPYVHPKLAHHLLMLLSQGVAEDRDG